MAKKSNNRDSAAPRRSGRLHEQQKSGLAETETTQTKRRRSYTSTTAEDVSLSAVPFSTVYIFGGRDDDKRIQLLPFTLNRCQSGKYCIKMYTKGHSCSMWVFVDAQESDLETPRSAETPKLHSPSMCSYEGLASINAYGVCCLLSRHAYETHVYTLSVG